MRVQLRQANAQRDEAMEVMLRGECQAAPLVEAVEIELLAEHARYEALEEKCLEKQLLAHMFKTSVLQLKEDAVHREAKVADLQQQLASVTQQLQRSFMQRASAAPKATASLQRERDYWEQEVGRRQKQMTEARQVYHEQAVAADALISELKQQVEQLMQQLGAVWEGEGAAAAGQQGGGGYGREDARRRGDADARRTGSASGKQRRGGYNYYQ